MDRDKLKRLGERAIACAGWRWVEGMRTLDDELVVYVTPPGSEWVGPPMVDLWSAGGSVEGGSDRRGAGRPAQPGPPDDLGRDAGPGPHRVEG
jgi:hypothetical protein